MRPLNSVWSWFFFSMVVVLLLLVVFGSTVRANGPYAVHSSAIVHAATGPIYYAYDQYGARAYRADCYGNSYWTPQYDRLNYCAPVAKQYVVQTAPYAAPLVQQGNVGYQSYTAAALPFVSPDHYFNQAFSLQKAQQDAQRQYLDEMNNTFKQTFSAQSAAFEKMATGAAASQILNAAKGLGGVATATYQTQQQSRQGRQAPNAQQQQEANDSNTPLTMKFCGSCHSSPDARGKYAGGFALVDGNESVIDSKFGKLTRLVQSGAMPPKTAKVPRPTDEEKAGIFNEIQTVIQTKSEAPKEGQ